MHRKTADKLLVAQNHLLSNAFLAVIFVIEPGFSKEKFFRLFRFDVFFKPESNAPTKANSGPFAFSLNHFQLFPVKTKVTETKISDLKTSQTATVKQPD